MRKYATLILFIVCTVNLSGQSSFTEIDKKSKSLIDTTLNAIKIANQLTTDLPEVQQKVRALYIWITHNIEYDLSQVGTQRDYESNAEIIEDVILEKKGVCMHYAELFFAMCNAIGIKNYMISGYTKTFNGKIAPYSHVWNAVVIDSKYFLLDLTWAAGYILNGEYVHKFRDNYFLITPKEFINTHMPFDPIWQFLENPINNDDFTTNDFTKVETKGEFNFQDSIKTFEKLSELEQLLALSLIHI